MTKTLIGRGVAMVIVGVLSSGCANRGTFGAGSCGSIERIDLPATSAYAVYVDADGKQLGKRAEDLTGIQEGKMCATPEPLAAAGGDPTACSAHPGYCAYVIGGQTYCLRCK